MADCPTVTRLWGALIFVGAIVLFVCGMCVRPTAYCRFARRHIPTFPRARDDHARWAMVLSKLFPRTGIEILDAVREDRYYCFLIPLTIVPTMIAVYLNWVGMMFFRHN